VKGEKCTPKPPLAKQPGKKTKQIQIYFLPGSRLRVGKVLAPYNARPKVVPLIKFAKDMCLFYNIYFPKNKKILK